MWQEGILTWDDLENKNRQLVLFDWVNGLLKESRTALQQGNVDFFASLLPRSEHYRIALSFPAETMFMDIETTGLSRYYDKVTLVGWSIDGYYDVLFRGDNPDRLRAALSSAKAIVTFNGSLFDLPFLRQEFPNLPIPTCHIDLRFAARRVGLQGGQKAVEDQLNLPRPSEISEVRGEAAALLWYKYRWGDTDALRRLVLYNHADIEGMQFILDWVVARMMQLKDIPHPREGVHSFFKNRRPLRIRDANQAGGEGITVTTTSVYQERSVRFDDLMEGLSDRRLRIVGIDLTGSETRPSGWCLLNGNEAITSRLGSTREIVDETIKAKPDLVSIDSPLSLPVGRTSVDDKDAARNQAGITRACERILRRRGINVYPCLIPSMQRLTQRGIELAKEFRSGGLPVIESYPGAAQDIMGIPRKRASLELLAKGMQRFGIAGSFTEASVSHDELDAITSAIVGLFFWSGKFEALGNEEEDYLIIPDLKNDGANWRQRKVVGLSGLIASGKTTAGRFLEKRGYRYGRFSLILKKMLEEKGLPPSRENLQELGDKVNTVQGQRWLCKRLVAILPSEDDLVIDGLRFPDDHAFLREKFGPRFFHTHLAAKEITRRTRYSSSGSDSTEFNIVSSHHVERMVNRMRDLADAVFENDGTDLLEFERGITHLIEQRLHKETA